MKRATQALLCLALFLALGSQAHAILRPRFPMKATMPFSMEMVKVRAAQPQPPPPAKK